MTPLEIALSYLARGWAVVPIPYKSKRPLDEDWPNRGITIDTARQRFNGEAQNVGVQLGAPSGGLADVDLDTIEAGLAAPYFLRSSLCFGRASKPQSHSFINPIFGKPKTRPPSNSSSPAAAARTARSKWSSN